MKVNKHDPNCLRCHGSGWYREYKTVTYDIIDDEVNWGIIEGHYTPCFCEKPEKDNNNNDESSNKSFRSWLNK